MQRQIASRRRKRGIYKADIYQSYGYSTNGVA